MVLHWPWWMLSCDALGGTIGAGGKKEAAAIVDSASSVLGNLIQKRTRWPFIHSFIHYHTANTTVHPTQLEPILFLARWWSQYTLESNVSSCVTTVTRWSISSCKKASSLVLCIRSSKPSLVLAEQRHTMSTKYRLVEFITAWICHSKHSSNISVEASTAASCLILVTTLQIRVHLQAI